MKRKHLVRLAVFLFVVPLMAAACNEEETAGPETGVDVEDVAQGDETAIEDTEFGIYENDELRQFEDDQLVGQTVTVSADINRVVEPGNAIVIGEDVVEGGLLVLTPPKLKDMPGLEPGMEVQIVGTVVDFVLADIETTYEPFDLNDELYAEWEEENALVARSISQAPTEEAAEETPVGAPGDTAKTSE